MVKMIVYTFCLQNTLPIRVYVTVQLQNMYLLAKPAIYNGGGGDSVYLFVHKICCLYGLT